MKLKASSVGSKYLGRGDRINGRQRDIPLPFTPALLYTTLQSRLNTIESIVNTVTQAVMTGNAETGRTICRSSGLQLLNEKIDDAATKVRFCFYFYFVSGVFLCFGLVLALNDFFLSFC